MRSRTRAGLNRQMKIYLPKKPTGGSLPKSHYKKEFMLKKQNKNAGKAVLMLFGISPRTHEPVKHMAKLIRDAEIPSDIKDKLKKILPDFLVLGVEEHFMTNYGEESSYTLPWDIFDEDSARNALKAAKLFDNLQSLNDFKEFSKYIIEWMS